MSGELVMNAPTGVQGSAVIASTTTKLFCSAMLVDASTSTPNGIALHMVRRNAFGNTME